jgi:hypothetical protein
MHVGDMIKIALGIGVSASYFEPKETVRDPIRMPIPIPDV